jgi:hypothetical protein
VREYAGRHRAAIEVIDSPSSPGGITPVRIEEHAQLPWTARLYARVPLPTFGVGLLIGGVLLSVLIVSEWALGRFSLMAYDAGPINPLREFRIALVICLMTAFGPSAYVMLIHRTRRTWTELRPLLRLSDAEIEDELRRIGHRPAWGMALLLAVALIANLVITYATTPDNPLVPGVFLPEVLWHRVFSPIVILYSAFVTALIVASSWRLSKAARGISDLDLLDSEVLAPFKSQALSHSMVIFGMAACASPLGLETHLLPLVISIWIFASMVAVVGLLLPLIGIRDVIRAERSRELSWCDAELRMARDTLKRAEPGSEPARFAELSAYRQRIDDVSEWPLDAPSFVRFSLYLLLPLGSWIGGALVERLVDAAAT